MEVKVTLFGGLRHFLPAGSSFNSCTVSVDDGASLDDLLQRVPVPSDKPYLVIVNDDRVTPQEFASLKIQASDEVVLLPPIKGG